MCGIVGFVGEKLGLTPKKLVRMRDALAHRGPDDFGLKAWTPEGEDCAPDAIAAVGLAHRRLSIIDLSPAGRQPMSNEDGSLWILFNGEFYNFQDYRSELETQGHVFHSHTDTETVLHLYEAYGIEETLRRMNGLFAFAIWDRRRRQLVLARDRVGKKPLFYMHQEGQGLVFASEVKAFWPSGKLDADDLDLVGLDQFWTLGFTVGARTVFNKVRRLLAGHYAVWNGERLAMYSYWDCPFGMTTSPSRSYEDFLDEMEHLLSDAIRLRLIADVPLGLFLSGGMDSSLIAALTAKVLQRDIRTFTVSFQPESFNEAPHARAVAEHLGLENLVLPVDINRWSEFEEITALFDSPFGDSSAIPTYYLSEAARRHVKVALTGDGGDELFAGYDWFKDALYLWGTPEQRRLFARPWTWRERWWLWGLRRRGPRRGLSHLQGWTSERLRKAIFSDHFLRSVDGEAKYRDREAWYGNVEGADALSQMQYVNVKVNLVDDMLLKVDVMSMAHGLECRSPLLDYRIIELAGRLPFEAKFDSSGRGKRILRDLLYRHVPRRLLERPKQGFCIPWEHWCAGAHGRELRARWERMHSPFFKPSAGKLIFPEGRLGSPFRQWNAFSMMVFQERIRTWAQAKENEMKSRSFGTASHRSAT